MKLTPKQLADLRELVMPRITEAQGAEALAKAMMNAFLVALGHKGEFIMNLETGEFMEAKEAASPNGAATAKVEATAQ